MSHEYLILSFDLNLESILSVINLKVFNIFTETGKSPPTFKVRFNSVLTKQFGPNLYIMDHKIMIYIDHES